MKILEELWYGRINPSQQAQPDDKSSFKLTEQIVEKEDEFAALLSDKAKEMLEQMREKQLDLSVANEKKAFISGFCLGARIMLEVMGWTEFPKTSERENDWRVQPQDLIFSLFIPKDSGTPYQWFKIYHSPTNFYCS